MPGAPCSAITAPGAPTGVVATEGNGSVSVAFVAPTNNGGRAITGYTVTSNPATSPVTGTSSPINVSGLTNGTTYTFTVIATNEVGNSVASSASTAVTLFKCGTSTISDIDNNAYPTVLIGSQCWTKENLKVTKYNDNTAIPDESSNFSTWGGLRIGVRASDPIDPSYVQTYGYVYNWFAAKGITEAGSTSYKNICPLGWHVPSDSEWTILIKSIDPTAIDMALTPTYQSTTAGENMKLNGAPWNSLSVVSNNSTGFSVLPAGQRATPFMTGATYNAYFWTSTFNGGNNSFARRFNNSINFVERNFFTYTEGFSIRCLKD